MAKFLFCLPRYHTNAVPWIRLIQDAGHEVVIDVVEVGPTEDHSRVVPNLFEACRLSKLLISVVGDKGVNRPHTFPEPVAYYARLKKIDPDVVIVRGVTRWFSRLAALCALIQGRRLVIYDQEDVFPPVFSSTWVRRAIFGIIGVPHVTARIGALKAVQKLGSAKSLPFGAPYSIQLRNSVLPGQMNWPPKILMVAKYRERKGHITFLNALAHLGAHLEYSLTLCGECVTAQDNEIKEKIISTSSHLGLLSKISFRDNVKYEDMWTLYREHDIFVLPSQHEPAAVSPIEAAWAGCAVLISKDSGTRHYMPPGEQYEFDPGDPTDIRRAISPLLLSPVKLEEAKTDCLCHLNTVAGDAVVTDLFESFLKMKK